MKGRELIIGILSGTILVLAAISCSPNLRYSVLSTFFDGVPEAKTRRDSLSLTNENLTQLPDGTWVASNQVDSTSTEFVSTENNAYKSLHPPYLNKECNSCHDFSRMGKLHQEQPALCYGCHQEIAGEKNYKHGPAEGGHCTSCHNPHQSEEELLLVATGQNLCLDCHDEKSIGQNIVHQGINLNNCIECHNPHSSDKKYLLNDGLCTSCHEDLLESLSYMHGPIGGDYCGKCHEGHLSQNESQLAIGDRGLCLQCHDTSSIEVTHNEGKKLTENCTICHNPHGGDSKYFVRGEIENQ